MENRATGVNLPALVVAVILFALAAIIWWDASRATIASNYGIGPTAMPHAVALFLAALGIGHVIAAFREGLPEPEPAHWTPVAWMGLGLASLIASIAFGGGFIVGSMLLFAFTARAFDRRALLVDLAIGFVLGLIIYLIFNNLLTLTLPQGPLERLI